MSEEQHNHQSHGSHHSEDTHHHYDLELLKYLWNLDYKSLAMEPGKPNGRLREARFVLEAKAALETRLLIKSTFWMAVATFVMAIASIALAIITFLKPS